METPMLAEQVRDEEDMRPAADAACSCGSGLRHARCCGLDPSEVKPLEADVAAEVEARVEAMSAAHAEGDRDRARALALALLEDRPAQREALGLLFDLLTVEGKTEAAGAVAERLTRFHPNDAMARLAAAQHYLGRRDLARAQQHARMLLRLAPEAPAAHFLMGRVFLAVGNASAAEHHLRAASALDTASQLAAVDVTAALAAALRDQGRMDEARALYAGLIGDGARVDVLLAWAELEEADRKFDVAAKLLGRAERLAPGLPQVAMARASLHRRLKEPNRALDVLAALRPGPTGEADAGTLLQKGQVLDALGRYDEAFEAFAAFKARLRETSGHAYEAKPASALVSALRAFFTEGRSRLLPRASLRDDHPQPIFIIGFPRSGTTLVEQTLSVHPDIAAGDELPLINTIAHRTPQLLGSPASYPLALSELWLGDRRRHADTMRDLYLNEAAQMGAVDPAKRWFTDKMPLNETHLGLIHILFPKSPIVHLVRHPLDVVLSVFSNGLTHGFHCAYALESAATHYALIADLIADYRAALPLNYHAVRYEDLVADQEIQVRGLLDFIGAPFHVATLAFHENARYARTASYAQVTEPLYTRSVHRYRNYLKHLEPIIPILKPAIDRLGYVVDN